MNPVDAGYKLRIRSNPEPVDRPNDADLHLLAYRATGEIEDHDPSDDADLKSRGTLAAASRAPLEQLVIDMDGIRDRRTDLFARPPPRWRRTYRPSSCYVVSAGSDRRPSRWRRAWTIDGPMKVAFHRLAFGAVVIVDCDYRFGFRSWKI